MRCLSSHREASKRKGFYLSGSTSRVPIKSSSAKSTFYLSYVGLGVLFEPSWPTRSSYKASAGDTRLEATRAAKSDQMAHIRAEEL